MMYQDGKRVLSALIAAAMLVGSFPAFAEDQIDRQVLTSLLTKTVQPAPETESTLEFVPEEEPELAEAPLELLALGTNIGGICGANLTWELTADGELTIIGTGDMDEPPSEYDVPWYDYRGLVKELHLPDGLTGICDYAFYGFSAVTDLDIPQTVTYIGEGAFWGMGIEELYIPDSVQVLGSDAFRSCGKLKNVYIGNGVSNIPQFCFYSGDGNGSSLEYVTLGISVQTFEDNAFYDLQNLKRFTVLANNPYLCNDARGILYNHDKTELVFFPGNCLPKNVVDYTIPEHVTRIGQEAFQNDCRIQNLTIPENVEVIGDSAFRGASLRSVHMEGGALIEPHAFYNNDSLRSLYVGSNVREIDAWAFESCDRLQYIVFEEGIREVGLGAFEDCVSLKQIALPSTLETLAKNAFHGCTALHTVKISDGLTEIGEQAFYECTSLRSVNLPNTLQIIGPEAFAECSILQNIDLPPSLLQIQNAAFHNCKMLRHIEVPESLNFLGAQAFGRSGLKTIIFYGPTPNHPSGTAFFPNDVTLFYLPEYGGPYTWTTPKWGIYDAYPLMTVGALTSQPQNYYKDLSPRYFNFLSEGESVYGASLTVGDSTITAYPDSNYLTAAIPAVAGENVSFSHSSMKTVTLPSELLNSFNTVEFYPESTTQPFVQAAYGRLKASGSNRTWNNLLYGGMALTSGEETEQLELYVDVNWNSFGKGRILLSQYTDGSQAWELSPSGGFCPAEAFSNRLQAGRPLYLLLETADGQRFVRKLQVLINQPQINMKLETIPDIDAGLPEGDDAKPFEEMEMEFQLPKDFSIKLNIRADGSIRGTVGYTVAEADAADELYDRVKDTLKSAEPGQDVYSITEYLVNQMGGEVQRPQSGKMLVQAQCKVLGYLEGKYVRQSDGSVKPVFTEGAFALSVEGQFSFVYQISVPTPAPMPFYVKSSIEPELQVTFPFAKGEEDGELKSKPVRMTIELPLRIAGGMGWESILSLGIYGEGQATLEGVITQLEEMDGYLEASFGAEAAVFAFSTDITIVKTDPWYFLGGPNATLLGHESLLWDLGQTEWKPQSRDYLHAPSLDELELLAVNEENTTLTIGALTTDAVYPYADVQLVTTAEGRQLAVWVADNGKEPAANRSVLYYSLYNSKTNKWTTPKIVDKDGTADFDPQVKRFGEKIYLVWKNASKPLTDEHSLQDTPALMDLKCAQISTYNTTASIGTPVSLGTAAYDSCVDLTETAEGVTVVWVSNEANSVFGGAEGACSIYRQTLKGEPEVLAEDLFYVEGLAAAGDLVWFTADTDHDNATFYDRELFCVIGGQMTQVTDDDMADTAPMIIQSNLAWYKDGVLRVEDESVPSVTNDRSCYIVNDGMQVVLYVVDNAVRKSTLYACFNDGAGWGAPMELTGITGNIGSLDADFLPDGTLSIVVCERVLDDTSENYLADAAYLRHYTMTVGGDLIIRSAEYINQTMVPSGELTLLMDVYNQGASQAQLIRLSAYCDATSAEPVNVLAQLPSGMGKTMSINLPLPEDLSTVGTITVTAEIIGQEEQTPGDNRYTLSLQLCDLAVESARAISDENTTTVIALVTNRGQESLADITVQLFAAETLIAEQTVAQLACQDGTFVTLQVDSSMENLTLLTLQADAAGLDRAQENQASNNTLTVPVEGVVEAQFLAVGTATATSSGASARVEIVNPFDNNRTLYLCAAAYRADGKLLDVQYELCDGASQQVTIDLAGADLVKTVRIFVLDSNNKPIQQATVIPIR